MTALDPARAEAVIEQILIDPEMPEHMVTKRDDEQMRALLRRYLLPLPAAAYEGARCTNPPENAREALEPCADPMCPVHHGPRRPPAASEGTGDREALAARLRWHSHEWVSASEWRCPCDGVVRTPDDHRVHVADAVLAAGFRRPVTGSYGDECTEPKCWASDTRHYHRGSVDQIGVLPGDAARPVTAGLTEAIEALADEWDEYALESDSIADDMRSALRAALAAVPTPGQESEPPTVEVEWAVRYDDGEIQSCGYMLDSEYIARQSMLPNSNGGRLVGPERLPVAVLRRELHRTERVTEWAEVAPGGETDG